MNTIQFKNIPELLRTRTEAAPDKTFLFSQIDGREFSYSEFAQAVNRLAGLLANAGIKKGDVVSLLMPNSVEYVIAYFACWHLGALAGPINSLLKTEELSYVISNSEARVLLVNSEILPVVDPLRDQLPSLSSIIVFDNESEVTQAFEGIETPSANITPDDEAIIIYTSGTTGKPKGCLLTHGNVISNARQISQWLGFGSNDRLLTMMLWFHMNAVSVTTMSALYAGGSSTVSLKLSASRFWNHLRLPYYSFGSLRQCCRAEYLPDGVQQNYRLTIALCDVWLRNVPAETIKRFEILILVIEGYGFLSRLVVPHGSAGSTASRWFMRTANRKRDAGS